MNKSSSDTDNFQIYLRIKPRVHTAENAGQQDTVKKINDTKAQITSPYYIDGENKTFEYNHIFGGDIDNETLFDRTMTVPISNVLNGFNSSVLIYGMTGAGKTHTMFGQSDKTPASGLIFLTLERLFGLAALQSDVSTKIKLSFYEIYNENIRDLLKSNSNNLSIVEDQYKGVTISDISEFGVDSPEAARTLILEGVERRAMNSTKSNDVSSRSHAIIQLSVSRFGSCSQDRVNVLESKFFLVDLAGNEKTFSNYTNLNKRFVEGVNINKSLLTLGKCINILSEQRKGQYVPFRDSKLTRLLKQSLGGNAKTVMIACVSPDKKHYQETLNTLKYSSVAANIKNKSKRNIKQIRESELRLLEQSQSQDKADDQHLTDFIGEFMSAIEEKVKIELLLENLLNAKSRNNRGSTSEDELELLIDEMVSEKRRQQVVVEKCYKGLFNLLKNNQQGDYRQSERDRKIVQSDRVIKEQNSALEILKRQVDFQAKEIQKRDALINNKSSLLEQTPFQLLIQPENGPSKSLTRKVLHAANKSVSKNGCTAKSNSFHWNPIASTKLNESDERENVEPSASLKTSTRLAIHKKPKQLSIDLTSEKRPPKEQFMTRVRWAEKNLKNPKTQQEIEELLALQQSNPYDLDSSEQSILRKLKLNQEKSSAVQNSFSKKPVYVLRMNSSEKSLVCSTKVEFKRSSSRNNLNRASFLK